MERSAMNKSVFRRLPFLGTMLLCFLCSRAYGQEKRAEDAFADFLVHLDWIDESGFLLSVEGTSNDSGPDSVRLDGLVDYQLAYGRTKDFGEFYKLHGTYSHQQTRSQRTGELSLDAPALFEERFFTDNKKERAEAVLMSASWDTRRDWGVLWYPRKEAKPNPKNPRTPQETTWLPAFGKLKETASLHTNPFLALPHLHSWSKENQPDQQVRSILSHPRDFESRPELHLGEE